MASPLMRAWLTRQSRSTCVEPPSVARRARSPGPAAAPALPAPRRRPRARPHWQPAALNPPTLRLVDGRAMPHQGSALCHGPHGPGARCQPCHSRSEAPDSHCCLGLPSRDRLAFAPFDSRPVRVIPLVPRFAAYMETGLEQRLVQMAVLSADPPGARTRKAPCERAACIAYNRMRPALYL